LRVDPIADRAVRPALLVVAAMLGTTALSAFLLEASLHAVAGNSDSATVVLEGAAISHGHLGLHGWSMTADSFWSVDALFYAMATLVVGVRAVLMNAVPSVIAALSIAVGAFLATHGLRRRAGPAASGLVLAMLCLPGPVLAYFLLQGPWHIGTTLWCLLAFAALIRPPTRLNFVAAVGLLATGLLGDPMTLAIGCTPLLIGGLVGIRGRRKDPAAWRPVYAVGASVVVALVVRAVAYASGSFAVIARHDPITAQQMLSNVVHIVPILSALFGVHSLPIGAPHVSVLVAVARSVAAIVIALGVLTALFQLVRRTIHPETSTDVSFCVDDLFVVAFLADLASFVVLSSGPAVNNARYLTPAVIFGSILGGRFVGRAVASIHDRRGLLAVGAVGVALVATFALAPAELLESSRPSRPAVELTAFLERQGLRNGIGDYWSSSIVTVESREHVRVRPVETNSAERIIRYIGQSDASWYRDTGFQFLVYNLKGPRAGVDLTSASATFGRPAHVYDVGTYRLLVWDHPVYVSDSLHLAHGPLRGFWAP
jgi:hypothetical protein